MGIFNSLKSRLFYKFLPKYIRYLDQRQLMYDKNLPKVHLKMKHLKNLKVLPDRYQLLEVLPKNSVVAEIGVDRGEFSQQILNRTHPDKFHLIDCWDRENNSKLKDIVEAKFRNNTHIEVNHGYSTEILNTFPDAYFDWIYIDSNHDYDLTKRELKLGLEKVKKSGLISGHDFVLSHWNERFRYGVVEAVNEFCYKYNWEFIYLTHEPNRHISFVIKAIED